MKALVLVAGEFEELELFCPLVQLREACWLGGSFARPRRGGRSALYGAGMVNPRGASMELRGQRNPPRRCRL
jgi:hypothetical protein